MGNKMKNMIRTLVESRLSSLLSAGTVTFALLALSMPARADEALLTREQQLELENAQLAWQRARLLHPTAAQRNAERQQQVFIYVAVTDRDVEAAMDAGFDRMESFLFANVIVTDENGQPLRDPQSGRIIVESEDCD